MFATQLNVCPCEYKYVNRLTWVFQPTFFSLSESSLSLHSCSWPHHGDLSVVLFLCHSIIVCVAVIPTPKVRYHLRPSNQMLSEFQFQRSSSPESVFNFKAIFQFKIFSFTKILPNDLFWYTKTNKLINSPTNL